MKKVYILFILLLTLFGCQGYTVTGGPGSNVTPNLMSSSNNKRNLIAINSLLIAPVDLDNAVATNVPSSMDLNAMLSDALQEEVQIKVVHSVPAANKTKLQSQYLSDAKKMNLDGVLLTKLTSFNVREGSELGSARPARVDFAMQIINSENNAIVWQSTYHFQDQALSDNLFKIKERLQDNQPKFRSAEEILAEGYRSSLKDFAQKRLAEFTSRSVTTSHSNR